MMPEAKAILVDLDGTLIDSTTAVAESYRQALSEAGVDISNEDFRRLSAGLHWSAFLPSMLASHGIQRDAASIAARKNEIYAQRLHDVVLNEPVLQLLAVMRRVLRIGLVTTASSAAVTALVAHFRLADYFDVIVTGNDVSHHKPHPEAYLLAASKLGVMPRECLVLEDSRVGVESARSAGMRVIQVATFSAT
jgi:HAD superfamily hydrolase (TIGR01509 family)